MSVAISPTMTDRPTELEDIVRSLRALARTTRGLAEDSANVLERELAMAINISERLRDSVLSQETLNEARELDLPKRLRRDAHQAIDLAADVASVGFLVAVRFVEEFVDERHPSSPGEGG